MLQLIHTCDIARKQTVGTNGRKSIATLYTDVACLNLPNNSATNVMLQFDMSRSTSFYFELSQDIAVGDIITYSGNTYTVKAVQAYNVPMVGHNFVMAEQEVV